MTLKQLREQIEKMEAAGRHPDTRVVVVARIEGTIPVYRKPPAIEQVSYDPRYGVVVEVSDR